MKTDDDLEILAKIRVPPAELWKVQQGIVVAPVKYPAPKIVVEMQVDVRNRVWGWFKNPRQVSKKEWMELRKSVKDIIIELSHIREASNGFRMPCKTYRKIIDEAYKIDSEYGTFPKPKKKAKVKEKA
jgi:hypothetical protein